MSRNYVLSFDNCNYFLELGSHAIKGMDDEMRLWDKCIGKGVRLCQSISKPQPMSFEELARGLALSENEKRIEVSSFQDQYRNYKSLEL